MKLNFVAAALVVAAELFVPLQAHACGGCFSPTGQPSVVRAHRMAIALSTEETTLWDQFEYDGAPEDFVWVLPVSGGQDVTVELSDNAFFQALTQETQITLRAPSGVQGNGGGGSGCGCGGAGPSAGADSTPPVTVFYEGTVGPYETVTVGSDSETALVDWLQSRGYSVPNAMLPTIQHYVDADMNFVVLRLSPGVGIQRMQPIAVTTPGLNVVFPLRMVAAGVDTRVSVDLYIFAEGRYEAANFPNREIDRGLLAYDISTATFNYDTLARDTLALNNRRTWLTEYAAPVTAYQIPAYYEVDEAGTVHDARDDWNKITQHIDSPFLTRMRADLPVAALEADLILQASDRPALESFIVVDNQVDGSGASLGAPVDRRMADFGGAVLPIALALGYIARSAASRRRTRS